MSEVIERRMRATVLTGPELVRLITKNVALNRSRGKPGQITMPVIQRVADRTVNESLVVVVQDLTLRR